MRKKGGPMGTIMGILSMLIVVGIVLAVLTQFDGDLGELVKWILSAAWSIVVSVRDTVSSWDTFQGLF